MKNLAMTIRNLVKSSSFFALFFCVLINSSCANYQEPIKKVVDEADALMNHIQTVKADIKNKIIENPFSPSKSLLPSLEKTEEKVGKIQSELSELSNRNNNDAFEITQKLHNEMINILAPDVFAIDKVNKSILDKILQSDISFETGKHDLKEKGKSELNNMVNEIEELILGWNHFDNYKYKDKQKVITVIIVGYADLQGSSTIHTRRSHNLKLSENRAYSIEEHLKSKFAYLIGKYNIVVDIKSEGRGEELPPNVTDTVSIKNPQRRVCLISSSVSPIFE